MSTLYVSDLDGTLLGKDSRLSSKSAGMLNEAIRRGADFTIATARTPATVSRLLAGVDFQLPLIVMTGAAIWDSKSGEYLHAAFHEESTVRRIVDLYRKRGVSSFLYFLGCDNLIHIYHLGPLSDIERQFIADRSDSPYKRFHIPEDGNSDLPDSLERAILFFAIRPTGELQPVYEELKDMADIRPVFYHDIYGEEIALMDIFCPTASKATAVKLLAEKIGADKVVAYGDNVNDLPILEIADDSVAVANAVPAVREAAGRVIGPNVEDSVAKDVLERIGN